MRIPHLTAAFKRQAQKRSVRLAWAFLAATMMSGATAGEALSSAEARGKEIYLSGKSPSGREITALVGAGLNSVPASALPCGTCHGSDGLGRPEGGVTPSNITWGYLTKPYGSVSRFGEHRPAYTVQTMARSITLGIDSAGKPLEKSMPRYRISQQDLSDLIAYLKRLESHLDPGVSDTRIILGTIVPGTGPLQSLGQAMRSVVEGYLDAINAQGGIYGRRLELEAREANDRSAVLAQTKELAKRAFALVSVFPMDAEDEHAGLVEEEGLPTIGPYTLFNAEPDALQRFTFHLFGGLPVQARGLVEFAARKLSGQKPSTGVIYPAEPQWAAIARTIEREAQANGWPIPKQAQHASGQMNAAPLVQRLKKDGIEALFFFGSPGELLSLTRAAARAGWVPYVFLPGSLAGKEIFELPAAFQERIFLAYATIPSEHKPSTVAEFSALQRSRGLTERHLMAQMTAYAATKLLVEGLKRAGRGLTREKLVAALEKTYDYETGLTPRLTYGPNRRVGAAGAHMIGVDLENRKFTIASDWIELTPK